MIDLKFLYLLIHRFALRLPARERPAHHRMRRHEVGGQFQQQVLRRRRSPRGLHLGGLPLSVVCSNSSIAQHSIKFCQIKRMKFPQMPAFRVRTSAEASSHIGSPNADSTLLISRNTVEFAATGERTCPSLKISTFPTCKVWSGNLIH